MCLSACTLLGTLPYDPREDPPAPEGRLIKPSLGWLATTEAETVGVPPDGSVSVDVVHIDGRTLLQRVRHFRVGKEILGDSILLDRETLRPVRTFRWTPKGMYEVHYNHRQVDRTFYPVHGTRERSSETMDVEPYSALGMELLVAALPLGEGYHGMIPVAVDTALRGWSWLHFEVQRELSLQERPDQPQRDTWIIDCDIGRARTRVWVAMSGRTVRKIEQLGPDNEVLGVIRRMLLTIPQRSSRGE